MLIETFRPENVQLGVKPPGRVSANGDFSRNNVLDKLEDAAFDVLTIRGALNVFAELALKFLEGFGRIRQEQTVL